MKMFVHALLVAFANAQMTPSTPPPTTPAPTPPTPYVPPPTTPGRACPSYITSSPGTECVAVYPTCPQTADATSCACSLNSGSVPHVCDHCDGPAFNACFKASCGNGWGTQSGAFTAATASVAGLPPSVVGKTYAQLQAHLLTCCASFAEIGTITNGSYTCGAYAASCVSNPACSSSLGPPSGGSSTTPDLTSKTVQLICDDYCHAKIPIAALLLVASLFIASFFYIVAVFRYTNCAESFLWINYIEQVTKSVQDKYDIDLKNRMQLLHTPIVTIAKIYQEAYRELEKDESTYLSLLCAKPPTKQNERALDEDGKLLQPPQCCTAQMLVELAEDAQHRMKKILVPTLSDDEHEWQAKSTPHDFFIRLSVSYRTSKEGDTEHDGIYKQKLGFGAVPQACMIDPGVMDVREVDKQTLQYHEGDYRRMNNVARLIIEVPTCDQMDAVLIILEELFSVVKVENRFGYPAALGQRYFAVTAQLRFAHTYKKKTQKQVRDSLNINVQIIVRHSRFAEAEQEAAPHLKALIAEMPSALQSSYQKQKATDVVDFMIAQINDLRPSSTRLPVPKCAPSCCPLLTQHSKGKSNSTSPGGGGVELELSEMLSSAGGSTNNNSTAYVQMADADDTTRPQNQTAFSSPVVGTASDSLDAAGNVDLVWYDVRWVVDMETGVGWCLLQDLFALFKSLMASIVLFFLVSPEDLIECKSQPFSFVQTLSFTECVVNGLPVSVRNNQTITEHKQTDETLSPAFVRSYCKPFLDTWAIHSAFFDLIIINQAMFFMMIVLRYAAVKKRLPRWFAEWSWWVGFIASAFAVVISSSKVYIAISFGTTPVHFPKQAVPYILPTSIAENCTQAQVGNSAFNDQCILLVPCESLCVNSTPQSIIALCLLYITSAFYIIYLSTELHKAMGAAYPMRQPEYMGLFQQSWNMAKVRVGEAVAYFPDAATLSKFILTGVAILLTLTHKNTIDCKSTDQPYQGSEVLISSHTFIDGCHPHIDLDLTRTFLICLLVVQAITFSLATFLKHKVPWRQHAMQILVCFVVVQAVILVGLAVVVTLTGRLELQFSCPPVVSSSSSSNAAIIAPTASPHAPEQHGFHSRSLTDTSPPSPLGAVLPSPSPSSKQLPLCGSQFAPTPPPTTPAPTSTTFVPTPAPTNAAPTPQLRKPTSAPTSNSNGNSNRPKENLGLKCVNNVSQGVAIDISLGVFAAAAVPPPTPPTPCMQPDGGLCTDNGDGQCAYNVNCGIPAGDLVYLKEKAQSSTGSCVNGTCVCDPGRPWAIGCKGCSGKTVETSTGEFTTETTMTLPSCTSSAQCGQGSCIKGVCTLDICISPYGGKRCTLDINCGNGQGGLCIGTPGNAFCVCLDGWTCADCSLKVADLLSGLSCSSGIQNGGGACQSNAMCGHGTCLQSSGVDPFCQCLPGFACSDCTQNISLLIKNNVHCSGGR